MVATGMLTLYTAFSRDQSFKVYVQHCIEREGRKVWQWLEGRKASVFIAGNAKRMPQDVQQALQSVCEKWGGLDPTEARAYMASLTASCRLQLETWS
jgi:sulfite reductase (NADPH) flavoprotein alpha-component